MDGLPAEPVESHELSHLKDLLWRLIRQSTMQEQS